MNDAKTTEQLEIIRIEESVRGYFDYVDHALVFELHCEEKVCELALFTENPRHNQRFLFHKSRGTSAVQAYREMLDYIREHRHAEQSFTIQWRASGETELHTSYFSAHHVVHALDKFFEGRDLHTITVYSVMLNPLS
jgi:hypothetical protein